ncbi:MAG TPA: DNA repair protein RecN, partial [Verrucomicrobia subdivision 3 bacterium]|nr:DNA repair protein RecN [Limisphaerales bacterium]
ENGLEPCADHQLLLKRTFTAAGANRQFINGSPTTLATLATLGEWLVDIHGPHEHQSLLHPARQLAILDAFGGLEQPRAAFAELVRRRAALETEKAALIVDEQTHARQLDLLRFQADEIAAARLHPEEEAQVEQDYRRASNAARLLQLSQTALDLLSENETCLLTQAGLLGRTLQELQRLDAAAAPLLALHEQTAAGLRDLQAELSRYAGKADIDPAALPPLEERLNLLHSLKRKYGATLAEVIAFGAEARRKLQTLEQRTAELDRLNTALQQLTAGLWRAGQALSAARRKVIPLLTQAAGRQLADLGFRQSRLDIAFISLDEAAFTRQPGRIPSQGFDTLEFLFAPNPGEPARPLRAIASSGELARVMLALKTVLAAADQIPVLVFDEVDANIGGETANAVGEKMRQIARQRQVLCITHLPQVAAPAAAHYVAAKQVQGGRTISTLTRLEPAARVTELARMFGGQTDAARKHAAALLKG